MAAFFPGCILVLLIFKNTLFQYALNKQLASFNTNGAYTLSISNSDVKGISKVAFGKILLVRANGDSLFFLNQLQIEIRPLQIFTQKHLIKSIYLDDGFARYQSLPEASVDSGQMKKAPPVNAQPDNDIPIKVYRSFQRYFPSAIVLNNIHLSYEDTLGKVGIEMDSIHSLGNQLQGTVVISDNLNNQTWHLEGTIDDGIDLHAFAAENAPLPALYERFGFDFRSDTLHFAFKNQGMGPEGVKLKLSARIKGLRVFHPKLSSDTIAFGLISTEMDMLAGMKYLSIDTNSLFTINQVSGRFGLQMPLSSAGKNYALLIKTDVLPAQFFFSSLPQGAFDDTQGLQAGGTLAYTLRFVLDGLHPEEVFFDSHLDKKEFKILRYGASNLAKMSASFEHTVYENGQPYRSFMVGPENHSYTPISEVPASLINAILVSEDPSFFHHNGFIPEAFRESIATNYKAKRFKRGGSTISMQLIKNVFLSRKKTVFRKIEEALIVWLIEGQHLTSKERMMEVYLNIIEWGPGIYGIGEASQFYFAKKPARLSLPECIYLANIIPRPKKFKYSFDKEGALRTYMVELQLFILRRMVHKEMISPSDTNQYNAQIILSGPARDMVVPIDTGDVDSLLFIDILDGL